MIRWKLSFGSALASLLSAQAAFAQTTPADTHSTTSTSPDQGSADIVVTAQRREESLRNVPISITALSGKTLDAAPIASVAEVLKTVPGVTTVGDRNGMGSTISVRGVPSTFLFYGTSPIAYYLDGVPFGLVRSGLAPDTDVYDLSRIEVLRGPQGTLYGASSSNGVVRVLTNDADLDSFSVKARAGLSSTEYGGLNYRGDVTANVPLIDDRLAVRATLGYQNLSGWIDRIGDKDANDTRSHNIRLKVRARPIDPLTIDLTAWFSDVKNGAPSTGKDDRTSDATIPEPNHAKFDLYSGRFNYDFGDVALTNTFSDLKFWSGNVLDYAPFGSPGISQDTSLRSNVFVDDLQLSSKGDGPWRWSAGFTYRNARDNTLQTFPPLPDIVSFIDRSQSYAGYGEITRTLADDHFEITGGLRYFSDSVSIQDTSPGSTIAAKRRFHALSPRVVLTWKPTRDLLFYTSYSEGFRSGVLQQPVPASIGVPAANPDTLHNYEGGAKLSLLDNKLIVDASVYYMHWNKVQQDLSVDVGGLLYESIVNGVSASGPGFDLSITLRPVRRLEFIGSASVNHLTFDQDVVSGGVVITPKGGRLSASPSTTLGGSVRYNFPIGQDGYEGVLGGAVDYRSRVASYYGGVTALSDNILNSRLSFTLNAPKAWSATLFIDNVGNEQGRVSADQFFVPSWDVRTRPRTIGLQIEFHG